MLLTMQEIKRAIEDGDIVIDPLEEENMQPASYDARVGKEAIVTRETGLKELKGKVERGEAEKVDIEEEGGISLPAGGLALISTLEHFSLSREYVGHIGMKSYYIRKGLGLLAGLQIDPGFGKPTAALVLSIKNQSSRSATLDYKDDLCTIEFHKLNEKAPEYEKSEIESSQSKGKIPKQDADYLRTIEAMSISEITDALLSLSRSVESTNKWIKYIVAPMATGMAVAVIGAVLSAVL